MEGTAVNTLMACMENYNEAVKKMTAKLRPGDGLLGFGRDPKRDPCHMEFYEAVGEAVGRMVQEGLTPAEAEEAVRFLVTLAQEERYAVFRPDPAHAGGRPGPRPNLGSPPGAGDGPGAGRLVQ